MTWYITIRSDPAYSRGAETDKLLAFLSAVPELRSAGPMSLEAAPGNPWVSIVLARADPAGNYSSDGSFKPTFNVVELICSDGDHDGWYDSLAAKIAGFLGWAAFDDAAERCIWSP